MGSKGSGAGPNKPRRPLLGAGMALALLGAALLIAPAVIANDRIAGISAAGVRISAMAALLIGAVLAGLDFVLRKRAKPSQVTATQEPDWTSWAPPETLAALQRAIPQAGTISSFPDTDTSDDADAAPLAAVAQRRREFAWSQKVFDDIEWRRFDAVCEKLFAQAGFETRTQSHGADGGVDIWLHSKHADGPAAIVQCKHWGGRQVGLKEVREFLGVMTAHKLRRGTYATTSTFTAEAAAFARENGVNALDGAKLLALIGKRTPEQQLELLEIAYARG